MRGNLFLLVVLLSMFVMEAPNANAQQLRGETARLTPDVVTIWHKLGIPQGVARTKFFKDSLVNRNGLKPGKERKPKLLRIADPANLEKPGLLKTAAEMKIDQDLAPQKIKALKYISSVGCSCYDKKMAGLVGDAIVEGMKDCSLEVRIAAMCVVLDNVGDQCSCHGQCGTCCSEVVVEALKEIAYKTDAAGCYLEPNEQVRRLAQKALCQCPPIIKDVEPTPAEDNVKPTRPITDDGAGEGDNGTDDLSDPDVDAKKKKDEDSNGDTTRQRSQSSIQQVSSVKSHGHAWHDPSLEELRVRGVVHSVQPNRSGLTVELVKSFEFPVGSKMVVASDEDTVSFATVISSRPGNAQIRVDDPNVVQKLSVSQRVRLGILD